jgi:DNA-binding protein HU-beta
MAETRMTQGQVIKSLAQKTGATNRAAKEFLNALSELAIQQARKVGIFVLPGMGRLKKVQRKARMGRNPATGEPIKIAAKTTAKFYLAKAVKDSIAPPKAKKTVV